MFGSVLAVITLLAAFQVLLVVKVADKLTENASDRRDSRTGALQAAGRYAQPA